MTRDAFEALTQIIIVQCGADDEVAHLLTKMLDHDQQQRDEIVRLRAALERIKFFDGYDGCRLYHEARKVLDAALKEGA